MHAVVLAAGFGRRMQPLTDTTPKTLLPVAGRPMINWIVDSLVACGIRDVTVVTGYRAAELREHLSATYPYVNLRYVHNDRFAETNNIFSLALAIEQMPADDLLLIESDLVFDPQVLERLLRSPHDNVALVDRYRMGMDGTVVSIDADVVVSVIPPHLQGPSFDYGDKYKTLNIYRFSRDFCQGDFRKLLTHYANAVDANCYYELILGILIYLQRAVVHAEMLEGERWAEIDDPNDLAVAEYVFTPGRRREILDRAHGGYWNFEVVDFCYLRNPFFPTGAVHSELRNHLPALVENYGSCQVDLDRKLAHLVQCQPARVVALNGAAQAFPLLATMFPGRRALIPAPSFLEYSRVFPEADTYGDTVGFDPDEVETAARRAEIIVFVNPNNPTGSALPTLWIDAFAERYADRTIIVDESFVDFSNDRSLLSRLEERPRDNVIIVKSLSKSLGIPGLRLGFLYSSNASITDSVRGEMPIWNLNSLAEFFMETGLKHRGDIQASFAQTIRARDALAVNLGAIPGVDLVYPSHANFLLVRLACPRSAGQGIVDDLLQLHGLYVKDVSGRFPGDACHLRLGVRQPDDNARLVSALETVVAERTADGRR